MGGMPAGMFGKGGMPGGMSHGSSRRAPRFDEIPTGTKVVIQGLQSAPQHNGKEGAVQAYDASSQRYTIELPDGEVALKTARLTIMVDNCRVTGITSKPELNGSRGRVVNYDPEKGRYTVMLSSGAGISLS